GSQLRLRFEQEAKLLKKSVAQVARRDKRIQDRELEIKNLEALLETEAEMKRAAEDKNAELMQELEDIRAQFSGLKVSNEHLSQRVAALQDQVSGEEKLKAAFEEFKQYEDDRVEQRWVAKGMSEGLKHGVEHGRSQLELESIEAYDPEAEAKFIAALQSLKDLKFSLMDQLEGLKDAPMDVIMVALYLESDTGGDAPQHIRDLRPSSSQLTIPVYLEVRDPQNPWACKEEIALADAIAANISRAEKKKKCRIVCRMHEVGSAHHARSDGVPVSVPSLVPQGLALLLVDRATQTDPEDSLL
nr:transposase (putative), gypsy type [Tanacetum cinerariifolium]